MSDERDKVVPLRRPPVATPLLVGEPVGGDLGAEAMREQLDRIEAEQQAHATIALARDLVVARGMSVEGAFQLADEFTREAARRAPAQTVSQLAALPASPPRGWR